MITMFVAGEPKAQPRPRISQGRAGIQVFSNHSGVGRWKATLEAHFRPEAPVHPYEGAVKLELVFYRLGPARVLNRKHPVDIACAVEYDTSVPDVDNLAKPVLDALKNAGVIHDDSQVVSLSVHKLKCMHPSYAQSGVYVNLSPLPGCPAPVPGVLDAGCRCHHVDKT